MRMMHALAALRDALHLYDDILGIVRAYRIVPWLHGQQGTPQFGEICSSAMLRVIFCANGHANVLIR